MTYPSPLKVISRRLTDNIVLSSTAFKRFDKLNFGARMALFHYGNRIIVWSAIPYGEEVDKALSLLTGKNQNLVAYLVIPDNEHTMAAASFKQTFPEMKIIASLGVNLGPATPIDYVISEPHVIVGKSALLTLGIEDQAILDNFEFVYLPHHGNQELVMFDKQSKTLFEADLLFNLRLDQRLEQFGTELGFAPDFNPHGGWSYLTRYLNPDSKVGGFLLNRLAKPASAPGLKNIYLWNFDRIVMCHGNVIEQNGREEFKKVFKLVLPDV